MIEPLHYEDACNCGPKVVTVSIEEIKENNYNLSPSYWINKKQNELNK
jgi:phenylpyruvate tautomerase PptA (4-oxalocrotonate tautomerase family)